uniref:Uncharacterized protein n=1 Tax=Populus alba TaxID=43335 RepID=A0A4U5Q6U7_POPAL|nr:hypothetical protein D5086_0000127980 [Populus alba]
MEWQNWAQEPAKGLLGVSKFRQSLKGRMGRRIEEAIQGREPRLATDDGKSDEKANRVEDGVGVGNTKILCVCWITEMEFSHHRPAYRDADSAADMESSVEEPESSTRMIWCTALVGKAVWGKFWCVLTNECSRRWNQDSAMKLRKLGRMAKENLRGFDADLLPCGRQNSCLRWRP